MCYLALFDTLLNYVNKYIVEIKCCYCVYLELLNFDLITVLKMDCAVILVGITAVQLLFQI
jgi:hypothetical protein